MYLGRIVEIGPQGAIYAAPQHPYTQALLSAAPEPDPDAQAEAHHPRRRRAEPDARPAGCSFHTRCPLVQEVCRRERPAAARGRARAGAACHFARPNPIPIIAAEAAPAFTAA